MKQKETRQEPVHQVLASYYLVIVYNSFTLQQQPARQQDVRLAHGMESMKRS